MILRTLILAAALAAAHLAAVGFSPAFAQGYSAANLSGEWRGIYVGEGNEPTEFHLDLTQLGDRIAGSTVEHNNFAEARTAYLVAEVSGSIADGRIVFTKTYTDPEAGATHSVAYVGTVSAGGRRISGSWSVAGLTGRFEMVR